MSRHDDQRLADVLAAATAIGDHLRRGDLDDGLVFDAVRVRLIEIGEAVRAIDPALLAREPDIPWNDVAGMRNHLAHAISTRRTRSCGRPSHTTYRHSWQPRNDSWAISAVTADLIRPTG